MGARATECSAPLPWHACPGAGPGAGSVSGRRVVPAARDLVLLPRSATCGPRTAGQRLANVPHAFACSSEVASGRRSLRQEGARGDQSPASGRTRGRGAAGKRGGSRAVSATSAPFASSALAPLAQPGGGGAQGCVRQLARPQLMRPTPLCCEAVACCATLVSRGASSNARRGGSPPRIAPFARPRPGLGSQPRLGLPICGFTGR